MSIFTKKFESKIEKIFIENLESYVNAENGKQELRKNYFSDSKIAFDISNYEPTSTFERLANDGMKISCKL